MPTRLSVLSIASLAFLAVPLAAQVSYDVSFPNAVHHEAAITVTATGLKGPAEFRMSRSSPGRYAVHEFAKNVYAVKAVDGKGKALAVTRPDPYQWNVTGHDGTVSLTYTLFADRAGGTYSQVDPTHAHLNMPATFMWVRGMDDANIRIAFHPAAGSKWAAATQLVPAGAPMTFTAPGLQYFMDSPTELSNHAVRQWTVHSAGRTDTIRLAVHHDGTDSAVTAYAEMAKKVVAQEVAIYGETARYDHGLYTFIADYLPWASGDGMEHRNSTIISSSSSLEKNAMGLLGTLAHEFFHSWNIERIRPKGIEPFDFTRANMSDALWFGEGFTSYFGPLAIRRAGLQPVESYAHGLSGSVSFVINSPARALFTPMEMSMQAPFVDAATSIDPTNFGNTFISYYTWGSVIGLGLDLTLREKFHKPLDGFMRLMWQKYGVTEKPYTVDDLQATLAEYTGDAAFAKDFFAKYVRGHDVVDYKALLANAGFLLRPSNPGKAFLGLVQLDFADSSATIESYTQKGSPLYDAGLDKGDRVLSVGGHALASDGDWQAIKTAGSPGATADVTYIQRGARKTGKLTFADDPRVEIVTYEEAGMPMTDKMKAFRKAWIGDVASGE